MTLIGEKIMAIIADIENAWLACATQAIAQQVTRHPDETFYGAGFWGFYMDYTIYGMPCFAMNTESYFHRVQADGVHRWCLPDWRFDVLTEETEVMTPLYETLSSSMNGRPDTEWDSVQVQHFQAVARVCRSLTDHVASQQGVFAELRLPSDFVVGIFEEQEGREFYDSMLRQSIDGKRISQLGLDK